AIFWDFENCTSPTNVPGHVAVEQLRKAVAPYGPITQFRAYQEITETSNKQLRSELQASGISVVDTPHNFRKDAADKMMIVDMLIYAMDNPPPSTIVVLSGDRDFAYALAVLRNRQYNIVLIVPHLPSCHSVLKAQADVVLEW
ncbi:limkain-b1-type NYN domain-containing protein, partial [Entophlyctis helioformis]